jgi:hypothetical protein
MRLIEQMQMQIANANCKLQIANYELRIANWRLEIGDWRLRIDEEGTAEGTDGRG